MHSKDQMTGTRFLFVTILNVVITVVEFAGGALAGSLSLVSDGFHNLGDSASVVLSYYAHRISFRPQTRHETFGYKRAQIISAFVNSTFLMIISAILIVEAATSLFHPEHTNGELMFLVAAVGTVANLMSAVLLNHGSKHNLNIKATYLHLLSDTLSSVGIIVGGILIELYRWYIMDPLVTMGVALYIMAETWPIIKKTIVILMQGAPKIDSNAIQRDLLRLPEITGVHHVHIWLIDENSIIFSAHINMRDMKISEAEKTYHPIYELLHKKYHIDHVTLQAEVNRGRQEHFYNYSNGHYHDV
ncbi:MAG: cation transporter [Acetilactobacillus jinshanensis]